MRNICQGHESAINSESDRRGEGQPERGCTAARNTASSRSQIRRQILGTVHRLTIPRMRLSRRASSDLWISSTPYAARQAHNSAGCNEQDGPGFRDRSGSVFKGPNPGYSGEAFVTHPPTDPRLTCPSNENLKSSLVLTSRPDIEALTTNGKLNVAAEMGSMDGRGWGGAEKAA